FMMRVLSWPAAACAVAALLASMAYGTAPSLVRPRDSPPTSSSAHRSGYVWMAETHESIGSAKLPAASVTDDGPTRQRLTPAGAAAHKMSWMFSAPVSGAPAVSVSAPVYVITGAMLGTPGRARPARYPPATSEATAAT